MTESEPPLNATFWPDTFVKERRAGKGREGKEGRGKEEEEWKETKKKGGKEEIMNRVKLKKERLKRKGKNVWEGTKRRERAGGYGKGRKGMDEGKKEGWMDGWIEG